MLARHAPPARTAPAFGISPAPARILSPSLWSSCPNLRLRRPAAHSLHPLRATPCAAASALPPPAPGPGKADGGLASLNELTERISDLLQTGSIQRSFNNPAFAPDDGRPGHLDASTHVVVLFGKRLIRDQVSVEYAKRIVTLVKQLAAGVLTPHIICFTGGRAPDGCVSEAAAGYAFFRSVCEEAGVAVDSFSYMLEERSASTDQNIQNILGELQRSLAPDALARCHFTLVSSDYHLIRLQEVHRLNPNDSALFPLQLFSATWGFIFAAYPFCVSRDAATAFLGRAVVLANDLSVVLVNLNCAVANRQFMAPENLARLHETSAKMRDMYRVIDSRSASGFRTDMRAHAETLELAIHRVREVQTALAPLSAAGESVAPCELERAQRLLLAVVRAIRETMDPDRVLRVADRVAVVEDMASHAAAQQRARGARGAAAAARRRSAPGGDDDGDAQARAPPRRTPPQQTVAHHLLPKLRSGAPRTAPDYRASELAGPCGATFAGNGKRIARDGPNVVVLDELAHVRAADDHVPARADGAQQQPAGAKGERARTPRRRAAARVPAARAASPAPLRRARAPGAPRRGAASPPVPRKRRSAVAAKTKAGAPGRAGAATKRGAAARKTPDIDGVSQLLS